MHIEETLSENQFTIRKRIDHDLKEIVPRFWPDETHRTLKDRIIQASTGKKLTLANAKKLWRSNPLTDEIKKTPNNGNTLLEHYIKATLYNSKIRINQEANIGYNYSCLALYHLGALAWQFEILSAHDRYQKSSLAGGEGRGRKLDLIHEEIKRLIGIPPEDGWTTQTSTADLLEEKVDNFIIENKLGKTLHNTRIFIEKSISSRADTKEIFNQNKKKLATKK